MIMNHPIKDYVPEPIGTPTATNQPTNQRPTYSTKILKNDLSPKI